LNFTGNLDRAAALVAVQRHDHVLGVRHLENYLIRTEGS
jgi:hypothetical protein